MQRIEYFPVRPNSAPKTARPPPPPCSCSPGWPPVELLSVVDSSLSLLAFVTFLTLRLLALAGDYFDFIIRCHILWEIIIFTSFIIKFITWNPHTHTPPHTHPSLYTTTNLITVELSGKKVLHTLRRVAKAFCKRFTFMGRKCCKSHSRMPREQVTVYIVSTVVTR